MAVATAFLKRDLSLAVSYRFSFLLQFLGIFFSVAIFYFLSQLFGSAVAPQLEAYGGGSSFRLSWPNAHPPPATPLTVTGNGRSNGLLTSTTTFSSTSGRGSTSAVK